MANEKLYEEMLTLMITGYLYAKEEAETFERLTERRNGLVARIITKTQKLTNASPEEIISKMIEPTKGKFQSVPFMTELTDPGLKDYFRKLVNVSAELRKLPFKTREGAIRRIEEKKKWVLSQMEELKELFPEEQCIQIAQNAKRVATEITGIPFP